MIWEEARVLDVEHALVRRGDLVGFCWPHLSRIAEFAASAATYI